MFGRRGVFAPLVPPWAYLIDPIKQLSPQPRASSSADLRGVLRVHKGQKTCMGAQGDPSVTAIYAAWLEGEIHVASSPHIPHHVHLPYFTVGRPGVFNLSRPGCPLSCSTLGIAFPSSPSTPLRYDRDLVACGTDRRSRPIETAGTEQRDTLGTYKVVLFRPLKDLLTDHLLRSPPHCWDPLSSRDFFPSESPEFSQNPVQKFQVACQLRRSASARPDPRPLSYKGQGVEEISRLFTRKPLSARNRDGHARHDAC